MVKCVPAICFFRFWNRWKSDGTTAEEYGRWSTSSKMQLWIVVVVTADLWAGWCCPGGTALLWLTFRSIRLWYCCATVTTRLHSIVQLLYDPFEENPLLKFLHLHLSLNCEGHWGITDDFTTSLFSIALWDFANSRPVHSLMLSHLFFCLPCLFHPFTVLQISLA